MVVVVVAHLHLNEFVLHTSLCLRLVLHGNTFGVVFLFMAEWFTQSASSPWRIVADRAPATWPNRTGSTCWRCWRTALGCWSILQADRKQESASSERIKNVQIVCIPLVSRISSSSLRMWIKSCTIESDRSSRRVRSTSSGFSLAASPIYIHTTNN